MPVLIVHGWLPFAAKVCDSWRGVPASVQSKVTFVPSDWFPRPRIEFFSFATGKVTHVAALEKLPARYFHPGLSISPDGRQILCALVEQYTSDIMLVENFR